MSLLSLGPMTEFGLVVRLQPEIIPLTQEVVVMGGSFNERDPSPEFNARCDPEAAQIVLNAGWPVHTLGLDVTRRVHFSRRDFASLPDGNPAIELLRTQAPGWIDRMEEMGWDRTAARCTMRWLQRIWWMTQYSRLGTHAWKSGCRNSGLGLPGFPLPKETGRLSKWLLT